MRNIEFFYRKAKMNLPLSCLLLQYPSQGYQSDTITKLWLDKLQYSSHMRGSEQVGKKKKHKIIRPLLYLKRESITTICQKFKMPIYPDKSNRSVYYSRNRIRKQIIPSIKSFLNPQVENSLFKVAELLNREQAFLYSLLKNTLITCRDYVDSVDVLHKKLYTCTTVRSEIATKQSAMHNESA